MNKSFNIDSVSTNTPIFSKISINTPIIKRISIYMSQVGNVIFPVDYSQTAEHASIYVETYATEPFALEAYVGASYEEF